MARNMTNSNRRVLENASADKAKKSAEAQNRHPVLNNAGMRAELGLRRAAKAQAPNNMAKAGVRGAVSANRSVSDKVSVIRKAFRKAK